MKKIPRRRTPTQDKETPILVTKQISPRQSLTPEGFLLCEEVPLARTGWMIYAPGEIPITPGNDGLCHVYRGPDELFNEKTLASFQGKPVTLDHPTEDVTPENWKKLSVGIVLNPRQGTGDDVDVMLGDMLITDRNAIKEIQDGLREVSNGYEADYEQTGEGEGKQHNIIGNHVALVKRGRCGPRCAIGDGDPNPDKEHQDMSASRKPGTRAPARKTLSEKVKALFRDAQTEALELIGEEGGEDFKDSDLDTGGTHIHIHTGGDGPPRVSSDADPEVDPDADPESGNKPTFDEATEARFGALEQGMAGMKTTLDTILQKLGGTGDADPGADPDEDPAPTNDEDPDDQEDKSKATKDSASLANDFQVMVANAEILVPGFRVGTTFDAKSDRKRTVDAMCSTRRKVLEIALATNDGKTLVESVNGGVSPDVGKLQCAQVTSLFNAAAGAKKLINTRDAAAGAHQHQRQSKDDGIPRDAMGRPDLNKINSSFWSKHS